MPIYYFQLRGDGYELPDLTGRALADEAAARAEAETLVAELIETARLTGEAPSAEVVEVLDPDLRPLVAIPLRKPSNSHPPREA
jgi:hypothetical protein